MVGLKEYCPEEMGIGVVQVNPIVGTRRRGRKSKIKSRFVAIGHPFLMLGVISDQSYYCTTSLSREIFTPDCERYAFGLAKS